MTMARLFTVVALLLAASTAHAQSTPPSAWYKWCYKGTQTTNKDGKEAKKDADVCWTFQQLRNDDTGKVSFSASLAQATVEGKDSYYFGVFVRGNIDVQAGMRVTLFPEDLWGKVRKHKKII